MGRFRASDDHKRFLRWTSEINHRSQANVVMYFEGRDLSGRERNGGWQEKERACWEEEQQQ